MLLWRSIRQIAVAASVCAALGTSLLAASEPGTNAKSGEQAATSPLEKLKQRSAQERYEDLSKKFDAAVEGFQANPDEGEPGEIEAPPAPPVPAIVETAEQTPVETESSARLTALQVEDKGIQAAAPKCDGCELRTLSEILPYYDYEPDPEVRAQDPYMNLCPRPGDAPTPEGVIAHECPEEIEIGGGIYQQRVMIDTVFAWQASNLYANPLYFEDPQLERYGHTHHDLFQPFISVGKFGLQLVGLPYQMKIDPPNRCVYALGWYRPGECAPHLHYQIPWNRNAAMLEAQVVTGLIFLVP